MFVADVINIFYCSRFEKMFLYLKAKINATKTVLIVGIFMYCRFVFVDKSYVTHLQCIDVSFKHPTKIYYAKILNAVSC
jgi:hypothetical protein